MALLELRVMSAAVYDTLILSDLHLGSEISRAEQATRMLRQDRFRRLILLGDIFSDLNFHRLKKEHWRFLSYIRKLSNPKRGVEVVWVEGNHDRGLATMMAHLVGVRVYHDLSAHVKATDRIDLAFGVRNLTDRKPPQFDFGIDQNGDPSTYDMLGRAYFGSVHVSF